jgi:hypothetical protein
MPKAMAPKHRVHGAHVLSAAVAEEGQQGLWLSCLQLAAVPAKAISAL